MSPLFYAMYLTCLQALLILSRLANQDIPPEYKAEIAKEIMGATTEFTQGCQPAKMKKPTKGCYHHHDPREPKSASGCNL